MNFQRMLTPAAIAAVVLVALVIAGLPVSYLGYGLLILVCPLMMFFMMRGMNHGMNDGERSKSDDRDMHATHGQSDER